MSWHELELANPALAAFGLQRFGAVHVAYLATVKKDGAPRVHPVTPIVGEGRLFIFMEPTSPKGHDLRRNGGDGRGHYALHSTVADSMGSNGEFSVSGRAQFREDAATRAVAVRLSSYPVAERYILFELSVDEAVSKEYVNDEIVWNRWRRTA